MPASDDRRRHRAERILTEARRHHDPHWIDGHHLHRRELVGGAHEPDLGCQGRAGPPGEGPALGQAIHDAKPAQQVLDRDLLEVAGQRVVKRPGELQVVALGVSQLTYLDRGLVGAIRVASP